MMILKMLYLGYSKHFDRLNCGGDLMFRAFVLLNAVQPLATSVPVPPAKLISASFSLVTST
jgi:hypothetical protein